MIPSFSKRLLTCAAATLFVLSGSLPASAQNAALGNIAGTVRDSAGAVIPNATVVVNNVGTGASRTLTTDSEGHYAATFLQPGQYEVVLSGSGFAKVDQKNVAVLVGSTVTVDATLPTASVSTDVVVTSEAPLLDTEKVAASQTVSEVLVSNLPVNGRRFDNFVLLTPNVIPDGNSGLISFRGISGIYNSNLVDGANNNQAFFSEARGRSIGAPYVYPIDSIKEFSSENAGYSAEFGQAAGGIINAITKSGANAIHGDVYEFYRTPGYNALDPLTKTKPVKVQHQFGGSIGGPIIKDKLFYHFTYDGYRKVTPITYRTTYGNLNDLAGLCDQRTGNYLTRGTGSSTAIYPSTIPGITPTQCTAAITFLLTKQLGTFARNVKQDIFFPRLDYQLNDRTHLSTSFLWQNFHQPNGYNTSTTVNNGGVTQNGTASFHERFLVVNAESVLTARSANVVHFQWSRDLETDTTNTGGPAINLTGIASYGETNALPRGAFPDEHRWQITDIYSTTLGRHALKIGADFNLIHEQISNLFQGDGQFSYGTGTNEFNFANWIQDVYQVNGGKHYNNFLQVNDPITHVGADDFWNKDIDFFVEDAWKVTPKLLLSLGARYDVQLVPAPDKPNTSSAVAQLYTTTINNYKKMIQPRVGFAWTPQEGTVVRGGYGIFYGLNSNSTYYTQRRENGVYQQQFNVNATTLPNSPYTAASATCVPAPGTTRCFQQSGTYPTYAPQGGIPAFTPPGPAPINQVTGAPTPAVNPGLPLSVLSARGLDPNFQNPSSMSFDLSVEQQLPYHATLTLAYVGNRGLRLPVFVDTNVDPASAIIKNYLFTPANGAPQVVPVPFYQSRLSLNTGSVLTGFSDVNSTYHSMVTSVRKPMSHGIEILANYTWSRSMDGGQVSGVNGTFNGTDTPIDPFAKGHRAGRSAEYARSDLDVRGRFTGSIVGTTNVDRFVVNPYARYAFNGFTIAGTVTAQTGQPLTGFMASSPFSHIGDGGLSGAELSLFNSGTNGRVPDQVARRNSFTGPGIHNVDARISRTFPIHESISIQLIAEAFNVANHRNILGVSTNLYTWVAQSTAAKPTTCTTGGPDGCISALPAGSTPFATPTSTSSILYGPRQIQLTGKLFF